MQTFTFSEQFTRIYAEGGDLVIVPFGGPSMLLKKPYLKNCEIETWYDPNFSRCCGGYSYVEGVPQYNVRLCIQPLGGLEMLTHHTQLKGAPNPDDWAAAKRLSVLQLLQLVDEKLKERSDP